MFPGRAKVMKHGKRFHIYHTFLWRHDIQHRDTQHNDIHHKDTKGLFVILGINGTQHNNPLYTWPFVHFYAKCHYADCRYAECHGVPPFLLHVVVEGRGLYRFMTMHYFPCCTEIV
jgi:hypothetical protein